ncbi:MAG: MBL fold metallo-hydrolase [Sphingomonadales bacterium]|jgi:glyoxylase-like metal-dependent hydrolase (beta-lactamase superfamily II)
MRDQSVTSDEDLLISDKDAVAQGLSYPFETLPEPGETLEVAPGVHWLRMPLPFALDHINLWLLEDGDGFVIIDTGIAMPKVKVNWKRILETKVGDKPINRIYVTHYHPDHIGLAGWLAEETGAPMVTTRTEYLYSRMLSLDVRDEPPIQVMQFYKSVGFDDEQLELVRARGWGGYAKGVHEVPVSYERIEDGDRLTINEREWRVVVGRGHAPEHACFYCEELGVFISGDQVLPRISSNVSVYPTEPESNPLGDWMESLVRLKQLRDDVLVLPAHNEPFYGLHDRLDTLLQGHCLKLERLARNLKEPKPVTGTLNTLFGRKFNDAMLLSMATGESLAHIRLLEALGYVERGRRDGVDYYHLKGDEVPARAALLAYFENQGQGSANG